MADFQNEANRKASVNAAHMKNLHLSTVHFCLPPSLPPYLFLFFYLIHLSPFPPPKPQVFTPRR